MRDADEAEVQRSGFGCAVFAIHLPSMIATYSDL